MKPVVKAVTATAVLLAVLVILASGAIFAVVFSEDRLAYVTERTLNGMGPAHYSIGKARIVVFRTFPEISLELGPVIIDDPASGDTVLYAEKMFLSADLKAFLDGKDLIVHRLHIGKLSADINGLEKCLLPQVESTDTVSGDSSLPFGRISVGDFSVSEADISYIGEDGYAFETGGLELKAGGTFADNTVEGTLRMDARYMSFNSGGTSWMESLPFGIGAGFRCNLDSMRVDIDSASFYLDKFPFGMTGTVTLDEDGAIGTDIGLTLDSWDLSRLAGLVPESCAGFLDNAEVSGLLSLDARMSGKFTEGKFPKLSGNALLARSTISHPSLPFVIDSADADVNFSADIAAKSANAVIRTVTASTEAGTVILEGSVADILGNPDFDIRVRAASDIADIMPYLPDSLSVSASGRAKADFRARGTLAQLTSGDYSKISASGNIGVDDAGLICSDTVSFRAGRMNVDFSMNGDGVSSAGRAGSVAVMIADADLAAGSRLSSVKFEKMQLDAGVPSVNFTEFSGAEDILSKISPGVNLNLVGANVTSALLPESVSLPSVDCSYGNDTLLLRNASLSIGNSDFSLSGHATELMSALGGKGTVNAKMKFVSGYTDVDQLLDYVSGLGVSEEESYDSTRVNADDVKTEGDPFMVPEGIRLVLDTDVKKAVALGNTVENLKGEVTIDDGVAILRQLGFTSDAARMQLTAMYKSPRRNHLFAGVDFHLMDIEIDKLIKMVPKIDSLVPMLKSFSGQAEFHLALETNLNSKYELKKSTILGAAAIEGSNLVVLDSDTFDMIAKKLMFKKSAKNVIDSLAVDLTVFRDEIDVYPFLVSMDNYKVILSGRHNLDMSFNYHLDCLSPVRIGLDVKGSLGNLKFGLSPVRYRNIFVPERRNDLQERTLGLMKMINSSLKETVAEQKEDSR